MKYNEIDIEEKDIDRIFKKVDMGDDAIGCWTWTAGTTADGYPQVRVRGRMLKPHRILFKLKNPEVNIEADSIRPACGNPLCINPDHQEIRGYGYSGHPATEQKLTVQAVKAIKRLLAKGEMKQKDIAELFDVHHVTVSNINTGNTWASVIL